MFETISHITSDQGHSFLVLLLILLAGALAGFINAVAGGGSALTLPLMVELGIPPAIANGTNRPSIFAGTLTAAFNFRKHLKLDKDNWLIVGITLATGLVGGYFSTGLSDQTYAQIAGIAIVIVSILSHFQVLTKINPGDRHPAVTFIAFAIVGLYGGLIQSGVGLLFLAAHKLCKGTDMLRANGLKALVVLGYTIPVLALFISKRLIDWPVGLTLATGTILGTWLGAKLAIQTGGKWIKWIVLLMSVILGARLWFY